MRELAEQAEELMVKRVQELRDEFGIGPRPMTWR